MERICIAADSTFDMTLDMVQQYGIEVSASYVRMDDKDYLDYPDRYTKNGCDLQGRKECLFNDRQAPAGCFPGDGHEPGNGQRHDPAGKKEDLEVMLDLFYPERQDEDKQENNKKAAVYQEIHTVHRYSGIP